MKKLILLIVVIPVACMIGLYAGAAATGSGSVQAFWNGYTPLVVVAWLAGGMALGAFALGAATGDYSWVDRLWSTAPVVFVWVFTVRGGMVPQAVVVATLVSLWGARLTFNFARRRGFTSAEDYRWPVLRERIASPIVWQLFNLFFICGFQIALLVLFTSPVAVVAGVSGPMSTPPGIMFIVLSLLFVMFLVLETIADQQQWNFQSAKHGSKRDRAPGAGTSDSGTSDSQTQSVAGTDARAQRHAADIERGFRTTGLFRFSRHPNYFAEVMIWWTVYFLSIVPTGVLLHWTIVGPVILTALFVGSTVFTESISAARYPEYQEYRRRTSAIVPWFARR